MSKLTLKGAVLMAPLPAVMVSCGNMEKPNIVTAAWTGVVCTDPARVYVSLRKSRLSHSLISDGGDFVINLTSKALLASADYCGVRSGREVNKFAEMKLTALPSDFVSAPMIAESPINLECKVFEVIPLGSHDMFLADVVAVHVDESIVTDGKIDYRKAQLVNYQHGEYYATGKHLGRFGFAAQKKFIAQNGKGLEVDIDKATLTKRKPAKHKKQ